MREKRKKIVEVACVAYVQKTLNHTSKFLKLLHYALSHKHECSVQKLPSIMISQSGATLISSPKHKQNSSSTIISTPIILDIINECETIQDNTLMDVLHVREEIVNKAMDICYKNYLEKQAIRFFVQCSYEAWMKILRLNFYQHDDRSEFYQKQHNIGQDMYPTPSIPDTWAANTVQVYDTLFREYDGDITSNDEDIKNDSITTSNLSAKSGDHSMGFSHISNLDLKSNVSKSEDYLGKNLIPEEASDDIPVPNPSEVSLVQQDSLPQISSKVPSYFTSIAISAVKNDGIKAKYLSKTTPHKIQKISKAKAPLTCNDMQHPMSVQLEDLPPVRAPATFKYNIFTEEERKRLENKKTSKSNHNF